MPEIQPPIQPVEKPILCSPYREPTRHWAYDLDNGMATIMDGRRPASYFFRVQRISNVQQLGLFAEETREDLQLVNRLREDVKRWRNGGYENATEITKELLQYWHRQDRPRRLFFCQLEAAETVIYLNEIRLAKRYTRFNSAITDQDLEALNDEGLTRLGLKMATGSGKTVVMAMLISWAFCNRGRVVHDERFPSAALVVCPNLTIKERLQVLRPDNPENYYAAFDLVPAKMRPLLQKGKVFVTNWHWFAPESEHVEGGKSYAVVNKGEESPTAFAKRILGELAERGSIMVLNDEAHHAWRPPVDANGSDSPKEELQAATVWINGLDTIHAAIGIRFCADLSATPFFIQGSGHIEGSPFPWLVSDFGLVDAIESGIVKIPRLPVSDTTGRPEPKYFRLWQSIVDHLQPGDFLTGRTKRPKPESVYRDAEPALMTLAGQWLERFRYIVEASNEKDKTPPVMIVVCDNTDIAEVFFRNISGEQVEDVLEVDQNGKESTVTKTVYGVSKVFPEFSNREDFKPTIRIDTKLLSEAESGTVSGAKSKQEAGEMLREIIATVGKPGQPGEQVRCVVSVAMLNEGWDAHNVTHVFGLRAFGSQLLCEQVVGRGLRRMDYVPDPETGMLTEEYVDIYGVPFSLIPFKGRQAKKSAEEDRPKNHVRALPERAGYEIRFPVVEGYVFALRRNLITADIASMEQLAIEPAVEPTAVFVKPRVTYQFGAPSLAGPGEFTEQDRKQYYESTHLQTIEFEMARRIVQYMVGDSQQKVLPDENSDPRLRLQSRHQLFPQVLRLVHEYVRSKVNFHGVDPRELGQEMYFQKVVERLLAAIEPDDEQGEPPLMPILNRYTPTGSTADIDFKTTKPIFMTHFSHINAVAADTATWEQSASFRFEQAVLQGIAKFYARNDQMGFLIPYDYLGSSLNYVPDFLVRLKNDLTLIVEIKGMETDQDRAKHQAAQRWVDAVNNWGKLGKWAFHVCRDPQMLLAELKRFVA